MLWVALAARDSGSRPSDLLEIETSLTALNFDIACSLRLMQFENEREQERFKTLAALLGAEVNNTPELDEHVTVV